MEPYIKDSDFTLYVGDALSVLRELPDVSIDCCITSPPYWGLRDYGTGSWEGGDPDCDHSTGKGSNVKQTKHPNADEYPASAPHRGGGGDHCARCGAHRIDQQLGLEPNPEEFVANMVEVFREVRRVLADHGTLWLNIGDSYAGSNHGGAVSDDAYERLQGDTTKPIGEGGTRPVIPQMEKCPPIPTGLKPKDMVGIPWRVAFALQADGWYLRSDIIWAKTNPMPESIRDRPTKAHEYIFLLSKQPQYYFDQEAVREPAEWARWGAQTNEKYEGTTSASGWIGSASKEELQRRSTIKTKRPDGWASHEGNHGSIHRDGREKGETNHVEARGRNVRTVWNITTQPYPEAHFATFPEELVRRCLLAGCPERVCQTCGKPSERIVERIIPIDPGRGDGSKLRDADGLSARAASTAKRQLGGNYQKQLDENPAQTVGWTDCGHDNYRVGVVLDPFGGSGTTALVARNHARHAVLIELNSEYCDLAARRLQQLSLFTEIS